MNRLEQLHDAGVSIWLDTLSRELLASGAFATLIADCSVTGATSNPTIFAKAITGSDRYDDQLRAAVASGVRDPQELFFTLALDDVRRAADLLHPAYRGERWARRLRLVRMHARSRRRHRGDRRAGTRAVEPARPPERDDQGPRHRGGGPGDRGAHRARGQRQRHAAVLRRALRAGDRRLPRRARAARGRGAARRRDRLGRVVLRLARRRQGRRAAAGRLGPARPRRDRQRPARLRPLPRPLRRSSAGSRCATPAPARSDRCGPAPAPRTPPTPTCSTSSS